VVLIEIVTRMRNNKKRKTGYMVERYSREPTTVLSLCYLRVCVWKFVSVKDPPNGREREKRGHNNSFIGVDM
jgi:hypothetical protein